jgi:anaerobic selenocysteine-containing dehydrogenase
MADGVVATVDGARPGALLADAITNASNPLKAMIVVAGNPLLTVPGGEKLRDAFEALELLVVVDLYRNATGELADFVLPSADFFEREDLNHFAQGFQPDPYVQWTPAIVKPAGQRMPDSWVLDRLLAEIVSDSQGWTETADPLSFYFDRALSSAGLSVEKLRASPDRTLPVPTREAPDHTWPMSRFDCAPQSLVAAIPRGKEVFAEYLETPQSALRLISNRTRFTQNSSFANVDDSLSDDTPNPLFLSPIDAHRLGLSEGDDVEITSDHGSVRNSVRLDSTLRAGVVAMTHGFGNERTSGMSHAAARPGVNVNALAGTGPGSYDPLSGMSHLTGIKVEIRRPANEQSSTVR